MGQVPRATSAVSSSIGELLIQCSRTKQFQNIGVKQRKYQSRPAKRMINNMAESAVIV